MKAIDTWKKNLKKVWKEGNVYVDQSNRRCRELLNQKIVIKEDLEGPINYMLSKDDWFYPSKKEITEAVLKKIHVPVYKYTYGERLFNYREKLDQISRFVVPLLKEKKRSRKAILLTYDPLSDSDVLLGDTPSLIYISLVIRKDKLFLTGHLRSSDLFFGWPANLYQLSIIQSYVARELGVECGDITTFSNSLHIFEDCEDFLQKLIK